MVRTNFRVAAVMDGSRRVRAIGRSLIRLRRPGTLSWLLALFLQWAPLVRVVQPMLQRVLEPAGVLVRWLGAAGVVSGSLHALSGATGIISATAVDGTEGVFLAYRYQVAAPATPKLYTGTGLPPGLNLNRLTGFITGVPSEAGVFEARLTAWRESVAAGDSFTATVVFRIAGAARPFEIVGISPDIELHEGEPLRLRVDVAIEGGVGDEGLSYRWLRDGEEVQVGGSPELVVERVTPSQAGGYTVEVSDGTIEATSGPVQVTVEDHLAVGRLEVGTSTGGWVLHFRAIPGRSYELLERGAPDEVPGHLLGEVVPNSREGRFEIPALVGSGRRVGFLVLRVREP